MRMDTTKLTTTWDLSKFFYTSITDPQIAKDFSKTERIYKAFERKYKKDKKYLKSARALKKALEEYQVLHHESNTKHVLYLYYQKFINNDDNNIVSSYNKYQEAMQRLENSVLFFGLEISKIPTKDQKKFLTAKELKLYTYFLKQLFEQGKHTLSEAEERLMNLKGTPAHSMWTDGHDKLLSSKTVMFEGKEHLLESFISSIQSMQDTDKRRAANEVAGKALKELAPVSELELNAIVTNKRIDDELRGYKTPYETTVISYETDIKSVDTLVSTISANFKDIHPFLEAKRKLLGLDTLYYTDRGADIFKGTGETYERAISLVHKAFAEADPECGDILSRMATGGQADVFPKKGKNGGAYCFHGDGPTFVLFNHINSPRDTATIAHEFGHAIHSELSKVQPKIYQGFSHITAEFASTFFEGIFFDQYVRTLDERSAFTLRQARIYDSIATIQTQIAYFNFELEMHKTQKEKGYLSEAELAAMFQKHMKAYLGDAIKFQENDGYRYVYIGHFRSFFYVFAYSYANLISLTMLERYRKDPKGTMKAVKEILKAGSSASPKDLFKKVGIDISSPSFLKEGLAVQKREIDEFVKDSKKWIK